MKLTVNTFVTLDGVMQAPGAPIEDTAGGFENGGWLGPYADEVMGTVVDGWFAEAGAILLGRTTYQLMSSYWPHVDDDGSPTWRALNTFPKYVVSTTLTDEDAAWKTTTVIRDDVVTRVREIKNGGEGELQVHGSAGLIRTLHDAGLVDEYRILQFPTTVGGVGKRLFADGSVPLGFEVSDVQVTGTGAVAMTLTPTEFRQAGVEIVDGKDTIVDLDDD